MKKTLFLSLFVCLFLLFACTNGKTQTFEAFYKDAQIENVDKIIIQDGSTGASKEITKQEQMNEFLSLIKDIDFTPQSHQEKRVGWRYAITLFDGINEFTCTLEKIGHTYYDSTPDIHPIVESYYKELVVAEE